MKINVGCFLDSHQYIRYYVKANDATSGVLLWAGLNFRVVFLKLFFTEMHPFAVCG